MIFLLDNLLLLLLWRLSDHDTILQIVLSCSRRILQTLTLLYSCISKNRHISFILLSYSSPCFWDIIIMIFCCEEQASIMNENFRSAIFPRLFWHLLLLHKIATWTAISNWVWLQIIFALLLFFTFLLEIADIILTHRSIHLSGLLATHTVYLTCHFLQKWVFFQCFYFLFLSVIFCLL